MKLNKKENTAEILSWFFGVPVGLIGLASLTTDTISGIMLLIMSLVLLPPVNKFANKKWNFKLSRKIKTVILILGFVGFVSFIEVDEQAQKKV